MFRNDKGHKRTDYIPDFPLTLLPLTLGDVDFTIPSDLPHVSWVLHIVGVVGVSFSFTEHTDILISRIL